ncbi:SusC/RagA family protein [Prevotella sp. oral taxon 313]|uniref:SusC/RagA family TonB-linked outer membrane protein n=1 Tax=Prevotella sp. oral taxon 313 TaxID=652722 RepID=UPI000D1F93C5|nr:TonB-dependent receptor [Prevotella sp. oral taxon 313]PTL30805.1 SusC/RagA family protein [Prevotella sp. oral taxon 313]
MYLRKKRTTSLMMMALFSSSLLHANITYKANAAVVQQQAVCKGTVVDSNGEPVVGASVFAVSNGHKKGSVTDLDGNFEIDGIASGSSLTISYVGYKTQQVTWSGKDLKVTLQESSEMLDNVVVVGYGTQKKVNLTGAVSVVNSKALESRPVMSVAQALQGEVPGLNFSVGNAGGSLKSRMGLNIRGIGTIGDGSNAAPLVLIDGSEGDLYSISPNDIESISVLKDASSSAIYGSRAAFGVILVTTKSGKEGRTNVSYNGNVRFSTATQIPEMPNSYDFARYWNDAAANSGGNAPFSQDMLNKIKNHINGTPAPGEEVTTTWQGTAANEPWSMYNGSWDNTNWFKEMYKSAVPSTEHNISVSGGGNKVNYYISGAILSQRGLIRHGKDKLKRYNFSSKVTANLTDWATVTYNTKWIREDYSRPSYMTGLFFHNIARRWPTNPVYDPNGHYVHGNEILQMENGGIDATQEDKLFQQLALEFRPIKGWKIRLEGNYNTTNYHNHWDVLPIYYYDPDQHPIAAAWSGDYAAGKSNVGEVMSKNNYYNGRFFTEYNMTLNDKHEFKFLAGLDMESNIYTYLSASQADLVTPLVPTLNNATNKVVGRGFSNTHWSTMGVFGRINYAYDSRYLAEFSIRRDGSSRFIGDKTWGTFPSFALGWNIANEQFFKPLNKTVNTLKLRLTYGSLGNTNIDQLYPWFLRQPISSNSSAWLVNGERVNTSGVPGLVSPFLTWERVQSWNIGLDFGLFNNKLQGTFDYFVRTTKNMVGPAPVKPSILGATQPKENNSDMRSNGWDLEVRWRDRVGQVNYGIKLVLSDDYQTITNFYNPNRLLSQWCAGKRMGDIYGYKVEGIAQTDQQMNEWLANNKPSWGSDWAAGDVMYKDLNGDKKVNSGKSTYDDMGDLTKIGNSLPRYRFGITLDANWKGFDFLIFMQGVGKRDFWDASPYSVGANTGLWQSAAFKDHLDYWRPATDTNFGPNPNAFYPRPLFGAGSKNFQTSDRYLQNAAYMRIKNIQIGYTLPMSIASKIGANRIRFYFSAENLATFTKMNKIFDPEATGGDWGPGKIYPLQRTVSFGLNLNF